MIMCLFLDIIIPLNLSSILEMVYNTCWSLCTYNALRFWLIEVYARCPSSLLTSQEVKIYLWFSQQCSVAYFQWYLPTCLLGVFHIKRLIFSLVYFACYRVLSERNFMLWSNSYNTFWLVVYVKLWSIWMHTTKGPNISVETWKSLHRVPNISHLILSSYVSCQPSSGVLLNAGTMPCIEHSHFLTFFSFVIHNNFHIWHYID